MAWVPAWRAERVLGKGLSPICSSMTSLPCAFNRLATARTSKAVSAVRPRAKELRLTEEVEFIRANTEGRGRWVYCSRGGGGKKEERHSSPQRHRGHREDTRQEKRGTTEYTEDTEERPKRKKNKKTARRRRQPPR